MNCASFEMFVWTMGLVIGLILAVTTIFKLTEGRKNNESGGELVGSFVACESAGKLPGVLPGITQERFIHVARAPLVEARSQKELDVVFYSSSGFFVDELIITAYDLESRKRLAGDKLGLHVRLNDCSKGRYLTSDYVWWERCLPELVYMPPASVMRVCLWNMGDKRLADVTIELVGRNVFNVNKI
jgi:hypothetical protein